MKYRKFGSLDWNVSEIGLGCWQIGADWGEVSEEKAKEILKSSFENGVNFFDTADVYGDGRSEKFVGNFINSTSERIYVATKAGRRINPHIADGYYEWQTTDNGKQPFYIHRNDEGPLYFGGLHQRNKDHEFVILTQESEGVIKPIHHRMPLMLNENQFDQFFDYEKSVSSLSREQSVELSYHPVSRQVNSPKNNGIELINKV